MKKPSSDGPEEGQFPQVAAVYMPSWLMNLVFR